MKGGEKKMRKEKLKIVEKITTGIVTTGIALSTFVPSVFADVTISGNGSRSTNTISVDSTNTTRLSQSNDTRIVNDVALVGATGGISADGNTNADVRVQSGDVNGTVHIMNAAGANFADLSQCGCENHDVDATIEDNGSRSDNTIDITHNTSLTVNQRNRTEFLNRLFFGGFTGFIRADDNTGGDIDLQSGDVDADVMIHNMGSVNAARLH